MFVAKWLFSFCVNREVTQQNEKPFEYDDEALLVFFRFLWLRKKKQQKTEITENRKIKIHDEI